MRRPRRSCGQCGQSYEKRACGPTHAAITVQRRHVHKLARRIARHLFTNGAGRIACRVDRLEQKIGPIGDERSLGGWGERPAADLIERILLLAGVWEPDPMRKPRG